MTSNIFTVLKEISQFLVAQRKILIAIILIYALPFIIIKENEQKRPVREDHHKHYRLIFPAQVNKVNEPYEQSQPIPVGKQNYYNLNKRQIA